MLEHDQCCSVRVSKSATVGALYDRLKLLEGSLDEESFQYHSNIPDRDLQSYKDLRIGLEQRFACTLSRKARRAELITNHKSCN